MALHVRGHRLDAALRVARRRARAGQHAARDERQRLAESPVTPTSCMAMATLLPQKRTDRSRASRREARAARGPRRPSRAGGGPRASSPTGVQTSFRTRLPTPAADRRHGRRPSRRRLPRGCRRSCRRTRTARGPRRRRTPSRPPAPRRRPGRAATASSSRWLSRAGSPPRAGAGAGWVPDGGAPSGTSAIVPESAPASTPLIQSPVAGYVRIRTRAPTGSSRAGGSGGACARASVASKPRSAASSQVLVSISSPRFRR